MTAVSTSLPGEGPTTTSQNDLGLIPHPTISPDQVEHPVLERPAGTRTQRIATRLPRSGLLLVVFDIAAMSAPLLVVRVDTVWLSVTTLMTLALFIDGGMYRRRLQWAVLDDLPSLLWRRACAIATPLLLSAGAPPQRELLWAAVGGTVALLVGRAVAYTVISTVRRMGIIEHRTVILGDSAIAGELGHLLRDHRELGLRPLGYFAESISLQPRMPGLPRLGGVRDLVDAVDDLGATVLLVTFGAISDKQVVSILRSPEMAHCEILIIPRLYELMNLKGASDHIGAIPVVRLRTPRHVGAALAAKRAFDVVVSVIALVALSPLLLACALAVRTTGREIIFRQRRVGKDGRLFSLYKFRSMRPASEHETSTRWDAAGDPRMTRVGRLLRRTSLDELPQLWNILRGEMAIVGPRPERPHFAEQFSRDIPHYSYRHRVPVGLTGMAQVNGIRGGDSSIALRARYDNYYIENWSLWGDVTVMLRTIGEVIRAKGS